MQSTSSLLPVLYTGGHEKSQTDICLPDEKSEGNFREDITLAVSSKRDARKSMGTVIISIALCMLTLFSLSLCIFSNAGSFISGEKILGYIASDFLGIDPSNDDRNFYEILMSGSFGDYMQKPSDKTDLQAGIKPPQDTDDESNNTSPEQNNGDGSVDIDTDNNLSEIPVGQFAIIKTDLSSKQTSISNQTEYNINIDEYKNAPNQNEGYVFNINDDMTVDPVVLIVHTHGTEAYSAEGSISYSDDTNIPRSEDITKNVVSVGAEMARVLNENGVPTLHCEIMHDKESYKNSYARAAQTIETYLKKYPSIQYVLDVHRDSVISENKVKFKPLTTIDGKATAQIMLVMGSDYNTPIHKNWKDNLRLAVKFTEQLNSKYTAFTRTMSLRASSYNQEYTKGSMLLEIGSCGNTLEEAKRAGIIAAKELSEIIKAGW